MEKVKEGDVLDLKIEGVGKRGDGIAKVNGFLIFVKGATKGEEVKAKIVKVMKNFAIGVAMK
mgnify:CR=1 FL=1